MDRNAEGGSKLHDGLVKIAGMAVIDLFCGDLQDLFFCGCQGG